MHKTNKHKYAWMIMHKQDALDIKWNIQNKTCSRDQLTLNYIKLNICKNISMHIKTKLFSPFLSLINKGVNNQNNKMRGKNLSPPFCQSKQYKQYSPPFCLKTKTRSIRGDYNQHDINRNICQWSILIPIENKQRLINVICYIHSWRGRR